MIYRPLAAGAAVVVLAWIAPLATGQAPALPGASRAAAPSVPAATAAVTIALEHPVARFQPARALGAGLDGHDHGATAQIYTPANVRAMASAGFQPLTYRLRTELAVEAWHWNPRGRWSDARRRQGYWTSSAVPGAPFDATYGYRLPRRGDTFDQANDDGYSRLDDGDLRTFWKSDPYLDPVFTHAPSARHAQWIVFDLGEPKPIDALELDWAAPYARRFRVDYWVGRDPTYYTDRVGEDWHPFPHAVFAGRPGRQRVSLADAPQRVRFVRVLLLSSSHTGPRGSGDLRDRLGFAVRELRVGRLDGGRLVDLLHHAPTNARQSPTYVSSTDPWHRARDRDTSTEQPSFTRVLASGLGHRLPLLVPVPVLYGTPQDAAGELRYLHRLHVRLRGVELGEEPDGQLATPEDYGALYAQFARVLRRVDRRVPLGGPGFQTAIPDWTWWPNRTGDRSWMHRFLAELNATGARRDYRFFSFEWYPFDDVCGDPTAQLSAAPGLLATVLANQRRAGLPAGFPTIVSEYGYSAFAGRPEVDLPGALLNADIVGVFLSRGGSAAYLYGLEPDALMREVHRCDTWGNLALFVSDDAHRVRFPAATAWAARMLTHDWTAPGDRAETILATAVAGPPTVSAYALRRPDGRLALLLLNKARGAVAVRLAASRGGIDRRLRGRVRLVQLSPARYRWHPRGSAGFAAPDEPPARWTAALGPDGRIVLPQLSLTVLLWKPSDTRRIGP
jgi:hypothetical protein